MQEATAYTRRLLVRVARLSEPLFLGLRPDGGWSIYMGEDPVFQFNASCELRRAYVGGVKLVAEGEKLLRLQRDSRGGKVELKRIHDAAAEQSARISCHVLQQAILEASSTGELEVLASVPAEDLELVGVLLKKIESLGESFRIAKIANAKG